MSEPSQTPDPSYTKIQLSGPPERGELGGGGTAGRGQGCGIVRLQGWAVSQ
ncbi:hypothetical protein [Streptomyces sp. NPDC059468]|uniref:hypothetical protein n=1 Tax=Streptomyces sp. NPDC059468 TaxID=3346845 RepID=UPI0036D053B0